MTFLHTLIHRKISYAMNKKDVVRLDDDVISSDQRMSPLTSDRTCPGGAGIEGAVDDATVLSMDNLVFVKANPSDLVDHKLAKVSVSDMSTAT